MSSYVTLLPGDPAPWFHQHTTSTPNFSFNVAGGRYIVLCFFGTAGDAVGRSAIDAVQARRHLFDDDNAAFFGITIDARDQSAGRIKESIPGIRYFLDGDRKVSKLYGAVEQDAGATGEVRFRRMWMVLDPTMRIQNVIPFGGSDSHAEAALDYVQSLPPAPRFAGFEVPAPVLLLPNVFEQPLCARLVSLYEAHGGEESGFMRDVDGKTIVKHDHSFKRRRDCNIEDPELLRAVRARVHRRIVPEILKVHQFQATRMERFLVACYAEEDGGHFRPHRDNTTKGTAHRRFAVSINLNDDFEGGEVSFPEYGPRGFKPPPGGAVVFSCSLLHAVSKVTRGRRYAFLPFLYDDAAAKVREANNAYLGEEVGSYTNVAPPGSEA
jgi:peroxiredoxin/predicted 2-oxoglutarate/Fe(II)-dependent dioxygenase YbiX